MTPNITRKTYVTGFLLSLGLTLAAYLLVSRHVNSLHSVFSDGFLNFAIAVLALVQLMVQLVFFLHLGNEKKPRWNLYVLSFAALIVVILVFGSLWIMWNLNYHHGHNRAGIQSVEDVSHDEGIHN